VLNDAPVLLSMNDHALCRYLDGCFYKEGVNPQIVAEFNDSGLLKSFGGADPVFFRCHRQ
jgi:LysR family transcriptional activator of nhaA